MCLHQRNCEKSDVFFAVVEEFFPSFHFLKRFMHTASESEHLNLWCHQDLLLLHGQWMKPSVYLFNVCWRSGDTNKLPFVGALWVMTQECASLSPENDPGWCLCRACHFCEVILQGVHPPRVSLQVFCTWQWQTILNDTKQSLRGNVNVVFWCRATSHYRLIIAPRCDCAWSCVNGRRAFVEKEHVRKASCPLINSWYVKTQSWIWTDKLKTPFSM